MSELHDGSRLLLKKAGSGYDATDRSRVMRYLGKAVYDLIKRQIF